MATRYTPLWIDPFENRLYTGWQNTQPALPLVFKQGDKTEIELFLVKKAIGANFQDTMEFPSGSTIRVAIGKLDTRPTAGTFTVSYGGDATAELAYNASVATISSAINGLASIVSAGGVVVEAISSTTFKVSFNNVGVRTALTVDATGLVPTASSKVIEARAGSLTAKAIYIFKVFQSVCVYQNSWTDSPSPTISVTELATNRTKRVDISPIPLSGSWSLTTTNAIQPLVDADGGDETDVPTYWTQTVTSRLPAFADTFSNSDGDPIWQMDVIRIGRSTWDFSVKTDYEIPVGYTMPFTVSGNFTKFPSKVGVLDFNTVEVEYLLDGASSATAYLEIEVEYATGERWTVLQTTCTIINDLIDQASYSPSTFENLLTDAPVDGDLYARQNGSWVSFTPEDNVGIPEAPVDGTPYLRKDGTWVSSIDGGTY